MIAPRAAVAGPLICEEIGSLVQFSPIAIHTHVLVKTDEFSSALLCLGRGQSIEPRISTGQTSLQIIRGSGELQLNGEKRIVTEGCFIFIPARVPHSLSAREDLAAVLCMNHALAPESYRLKHDAQ